VEAADPTLMVEKAEVQAVSVVGQDVPGKDLAVRIDLTVPETALQAQETDQIDRVAQTGRVAQADHKEVQAAQEIGQINHVRNPVVHTMDLDTSAKARDKGARMSKSVAKEGAETGVIGDNTHRKRSFSYFSERLPIRSKFAALKHKTLAFLLKVA